MTKRPSLHGKRNAIDARKLYKRVGAAALAALVFVAVSATLVSPASTISEDEATPEAGFFLSEESPKADSGASEHSAKEEKAKEPEASKSADSDPKEERPAASDEAAEASAAQPDESGEGAPQDASDAAQGATAPQSEAGAKAQPSADGQKMPAQKFKEDVVDESAKDESGKPKVVMTVSVDAPEGALPAGATMHVKRVEDKKVIRAAKEEAAESADIAKADAQVMAVDISFEDADGTEIEPAGQLHVVLGAPEVSDIERAEDLAVVHVDDDLKAEALASKDVQLKQKREEVAFDAERFSVYALVYTVDFHFQVDGKQFDFSIPGGSAIALSSVVEQLGVAADDEGDTTSDRVAKFVEQVKSVKFSDESLVSVSKASTDTTVGAIKGRLGLKPEYSGDLSDDDIAAIDAMSISAGDWALISLKPFTSDESLTVTMQNGDTFTIAVTDAASGAIVTINSNKFGAVYRSYSSASGLRDEASDGSSIAKSNLFFIPKEGYEFAYVEINGKKYERENWSSYGFGTQDSYYRIAHTADTGGKSLWSDSDGQLDVKVFFRPKNAFDLNYKTAIVGESSKEVFDSTSCDSGTIVPVNALIDPKTGIVLDSNTLKVLSGFGGTATISDSDKYAFLGWYTRGTGDETFPTARASQELIQTNLSWEKVKSLYEKGYTAADVVAVFGEVIHISYRAPMGDTSVTSAGESIIYGSKAQGSVAQTSKPGNRTFVAWVDEDGNVVSESVTFVPEGSQIRNGAVYIAQYVASGNDKNPLLATSNMPDAVTWRNDANNRASSNRYFASELPLTFNLYFRYAEGYEVVSTVLNGNDIKDKDVWSVNSGNRQYTAKSNDVFNSYAVSGLNRLVVTVKPSGTISVAYKAEGPGSVSNDSDFAGWSGAQGSIATPDAGQYFLGWYFDNGNLATSSAVITPENLTDWKNAGLISEGSTITARFGAGYTISYKQQLDDAEATVLDSEHITANTPNGYTAPDVDGYNFLGWFDDSDALIANSKTLAASQIGTMDSDKTFIAKYASSHRATYSVEHVDAAKSGVSTYGSIVVGSASTTTDAAQTANAENVLTSGATAVAARGCEFVKWVVKVGGVELSESEVQSQFGFSVYAPNIPAGLQISSDVEFTAQFKKQAGAMEVVYTIQEDTDPSSHAARLTVNGSSVEGNGSETAYISEVVPAGQAALGCTAVGTEYKGQSYAIRGWVLGDDNEPDKDTIFTQSSTFIPVGEYLEDVNNDGVRYFRVVTKKEKNIYVMFKVNVSEAGSIGHTSSEHRLDTLVYVNSTDLPSHKTRDQIFGDVDNSRGFSWNNVYVNKGYKLVGFTYNGVDLDLTTPISVEGNSRDKNAGALSANNFRINETAGYTDLLEYMAGASELYLDDATTEVERHVNILIARYEIEGYNIEYHVKDGLGGTVSNPADAYTELEKNAGSKEDGSDLIKGSTAIADSGADYVFVRWEDEAGKVVSTDPYYAPGVASITDSNKTYHYYAVFEYRPKLTVRYIPEDATFGMTNPGEETVHQGVAANGSVATAFEGYVFSHWTRDGSDDSLSTSEAFVPTVFGVSDDDEDNITSVDFSAQNEVTFVAHFRPEIDSKITVKKDVALKDATELELSDIDTTIYVALTRGGQDVLDRNGKLLVKEIEVEDGVAKNDAVFEGLPYNEAGEKYEVWEMHKVGSAYERQYVGMLVGETANNRGIQLTAISTSNNSALSGTGEGVQYGTGSGNNAILTKDHNNAEVTLTNTYGIESDATSFTVRKEWQDSDGNILLGEQRPERAQVELTVYSENAAGETHAVKTVTLDGVADDDGEKAPWLAEFDNLPRLSGGSNPEVLTYKVRETGMWDAYKPFINSGNTYLSEGLYLYNSGGKIINRQDKQDTVLVSVRKADKANPEVLLAGAKFKLSKAESADGTFANFYDGSHPSGEYEVGGAGDGLGVFSVALPDGSYQLQEISAPNGYIIASEPYSFTVQGGALVGEAVQGSIDIDVENRMITVLDQAGMQLPAAGGVGTTWFYVVGSFLVIGAFAWFLFGRRLWPASPRRSPKPRYAKRR